VPPGLLKSQPISAANAIEVSYKFYTTLAVLNPVVNSIDPNEKISRKPLFGPLLTRPWP
jgi:hypothetical protein